MAYQPARGVTRCKDHDQCGDNQRDEGKSTSSFHNRFSSFVFVLSTILAHKIRPSKYMAQRTRRYS
jgi:hypothetical protein